MNASETHITSKAGVSGRRIHVFVLALHYFVMRWKGFAQCVVLFSRVYPLSAHWITVIVSFVVLSEMTDYNQQDEWGQIILKEHIWPSRLFMHPLTPPPRAPGVPGLAPGTWSFIWMSPSSGSWGLRQLRTTGHRRGDPTGQVTRRLPVSQCSHTIEFLAFLGMFEIEAQPFPFGRGEHHPKPIEKESRVTTVWYTPARNRKICKDLIRRKSGNCSNQREFFPSLLAPEILEVNSVHCHSSVLFPRHYKLQAVYFLNASSWWISNVSNVSGDLRAIFQLQ